MVQGGFEVSKFEDRKRVLMARFAQKVGEAVADAINSPEVDEILGELTMLYMTESAETHKPKKRN